MSWLTRIGRPARKAAGAALLTFGVVVALAGAAGVVYGGPKADSSLAAGPDLAASARESFAIADFDGDRKPDLATVEVQQASAARNAHYSIRFALTARGAQSFGVTAPVGGLQIVARDVNGDSFLDLLVSTAWQNKEVAVLLNDGQGNFTLADPDEFATSFRERGTQWNLTTTGFFETEVLPRPESSARGMRSECRFDRPFKVLGMAIAGTPCGSNQRLLHPLLGRAPPVRVL